jgi:hypothetical protein
MRDGRALQRIFWGTALILAVSFLSGGAAHAEQRYTGVWENGGGNHYLWVGSDWDGFVDKWEELAGQNLRLVDLETYVEGGQRKYAGVWRAGTDGYFLWAGVDWKSFDNKWKELSRLNLRLIDIETYTEGGRRLYAGVWRSGNDGHYLWVGADWKTFESKWKDLAKQGLRLIDVETYVDGGKRKYAGVWRAGNDGYYLWAGVSWTSFEAKWKELARKNLRLIDIESYEEGGTTKYVGVWRGGTGGYYLWAGADWESFTGTWNELNSGTLRLTDLEINPGKCGDSCTNQVVSNSSYNYGITRTSTHCPGRPGTCGSPGVNDRVWYRWPVNETGGQQFARVSVLQVPDAFLTLPFSDTQVKRRGIWLYSPGSWHHAADYSRDDLGTFAVRAAAPGRVVHIGWDDWSGNTIVVSHDAGRAQDAYRTIYMHLRDGASNDCALGWSESMPSLASGSQERTDYRTHLIDTGCAENPADRDLDAAHWGQETETIDAGLLGQTVQRGQFLAWAGNTGPGGKRGAGNANTHLHIFFARRDPQNNEWYFFDPYGIYGPQNCYPSSITGKPGGACVRYPVAWRNGAPGYP